MKINNLQIAQLQGKSKRECEEIITPAFNEWEDNEDKLLVDLDSILKTSFPDECIFSSYFYISDNWMTFDKNAYQKWLSMDNAVGILIISDKDGCDVEKLELIGCISIDINDDKPHIRGWKVENGNSKIIIKVCDVLGDYIEKSEYVRAYINATLIRKWFEDNFD